MFGDINYFSCMRWCAFFRSLQLLVLPMFFTSVTLWVVLFFQFWKHRNSTLLARYVINVMAISVVLFFVVHIIYFLCNKIIFTFASFFFFMFFNLIYPLVPVDFGVVDGK